MTTQSSPSDQTELERLQDLVCWFNRKPPTDCPISHKKWWNRRPWHHIETVQRARLAKRAREDLGKAWLVGKWEEIT